MVTSMPIFRKYFHVLARDTPPALRSFNTAIFIMPMVVSSAVFAHDVSERAGDVSMGTTVFPIGWIYSVSFQKLGDG